MGPFIEDKIFIMEKGRQLNINQDLANLVCLPEALLQGLLHNLNKEELKEINDLKSQFSNYIDYLKCSLEKLAK